MATQQTPETDKKTGRPAPSEKSAKKTSETAKEPKAVFRSSGEAKVQKKPIDYKNEEAEDEERERNMQDPAEG